jgi:hypothetical protein
MGDEKHGAQGKDRPKDGVGHVRHYRHRTRADHRARERNHCSRDLGRHLKS